MPGLKPKVKPNKTKDGSSGNPTPAAEQAKDRIAEVLDAIISTFQLAAGGLSAASSNIPQRIRRLFGRTDGLKPGALPSAHDELLKAKSDKIKSKGLLGKVQRILGIFASGLLMESIIEIVAEWMFQEEKTAGLKGSSDKTDQNCQDADAIAAKVGAAVTEALNAHMEQVKAALASIDRNEHPEEFAAVVRCGDDAIDQTTKILQDLVKDRDECISSTLNQMLSDAAEVCGCETPRVPTPCELPEEKTPATKCPEPPKICAPVETMPATVCPPPAVAPAPTPGSVTPPAPAPAPTPAPEPVPTPPPAPVPATPAPELDKPCPKETRPATVVPQEPPAPAKPCPPEESKQPVPPSPPSPPNPPEDKEPSEPAPCPPESTPEPECEPTEKADCSLKTAIGIGMVILAVGVLIDIALDCLAAELPAPAPEPPAPEPQPEPAPAPPEAHQPPPPPITDPDKEPPPPPKKMVPPPADHEPPPPPKQVTAPAPAPEAPAPVPAPSAEPALVGAGSGGGSSINVHKAGAW